MRKKKYKFNTQTLSYEVQRVPLSKRFSKYFMLFIASLLMFGGYYFIYSVCFNLDSPKITRLKQRSDELYYKLGLLNRKFEDYSATLTELQLRDNSVYRPVFGMVEISQDVRDAGFGGVDRYTHLEDMGSPAFLVDISKKMDILYKKASVQSKSYDEVSVLAKRAGEMAQSVPSIPPVALSHIRFSSFFGYRADPFSKIPTFHSGLDFAGKKGEPIFVTGNGTVVEVSHSFVGYGTEIVIDHGFGYKTRYAHLSKTFVKVGDTVTRGEQIAAMGTTGKSSGVHLHYEIMYMDKKINPINHFNREIEDSELEKIHILRDNSNHNNG